MRLDYYKLVRDGIPRIIEAGGGHPVTRVLDQVGYLAALRAKLVEEAEEARAAPWPYGASRAMCRLLPVAGHAVNHVWEAGAPLAAWICVTI